MIGTRTRLSLAQFLELQEADFCQLLLNKYDVCTGFYHGQNLQCLQQSLLDASQEQVLAVLSEIMRTEGDLRGRVTPRYRFDERHEDLKHCLAMDGYLVSHKKLVPADPSIHDAPPPDDDLIAELKQCGAPRASEIIRKINDSSDAFRAAPPNYNACLNDARVALESLAADIANAHRTANGQGPDLTKWGSVILHLRTIGVITLEEEHGLAGVYRFLSPGSHRPIGVTDEQFARLGRSFSLNMCWFLLKRHSAFGR